MRYYNENPQVRYWMGKCAILQQELDKLNDELSEVKQSRDFWKNDIINTEERIIKAFKRFNALPWYKKAFFKFKV